MTSFLKLTLASGLAVALAACATAAPPTLQIRLNDQMAAITALDQKLVATQDANARRELLRQKQEAVRAGAALLNQAQAARQAREQACVAQERHLPSDAQTCFGESPEDTQTRMLGLLVQALAEDGAAR